MIDPQFVKAMKLCYQVLKDNISHDDVCCFDLFYRDAKSDMMLNDKCHFDFRSDEILYFFDDVFHDICHFHFCYHDAYFDHLPVIKYHKNRNDNSIIADDAV